MLFLIFAVVAIAAALVRGGRFSNVGQHDIRCLWLPILAYALRFALPLIFDRAGVSLQLSQVLTCLPQFGLLIAFALLNFRGNAWSKVFGAGAALNFAVIAANGGVMPVTTAAIANLSAGGAAALTSGEIFAYALADAQTRLLFLGDVIYLHIGEFSLGYASIGDVLLGLGVGMFCWHILQKNNT